MGNKHSCNHCFVGVGSTKICHLCGVLYKTNIFSTCQQITIEILLLENKQTCECCIIQGIRVIQDSKSSKQKTKTTCCHKCGKGAKKVSFSGSESTPFIQIEIGK